MDRAHPERLLVRDETVKIAAASRLDWVGALLFGAAALWTYAAASINGGNAHPSALVLAAAGGALVLGRTLGTVARWLVPSIVVAVAAGLAIGAEDLLSREPLAGPFSYANATGAFFVQTAIAGAMVAAAIRTPVLRIVGLAAAVGAAIVPFVIGSLAAAAAVFLIPLGLLGLTGNRGARTAIAISAGIVALALLVTMWIGGTYRRNGQSGAVASLTEVITERRASLWSEALQLIKENPVAGVGPGRFQFESPTARADRDARWAHQGFLQVGAESGVPGFILLALVFGWGFARLWTTPDADAVTALGASALAALGILACLDYVLHFPVIPITAAALVGSSTARPKDRYDHQLSPA